MWAMWSCQFRHYVPVDDESDTDSDNDTIDHESDNIVERKGSQPSSLWLWSMWLAISHF